MSPLPISIITWKTSPLADAAAVPVRYEIEHVSRYLYASPMRNCVMSLCLKPRDDPGQRLLRFEVSTVPDASLNDERDSFGNTKHVLNIHREHQGLEITARSTVETSRIIPAPHSSGAQSWKEVRSWTESFVYWDFTHASALTGPSPALTNFVDRLGLMPGEDPVESLRRLSDTLHHSFEYVPGSTSAVSPIDDILESGQGVCQDYAHVMIAIARSWGVPARYVSGYVCFSETGMQAPESASHAWVECRLPDLGWVAFDPTNRGFVDERYVRIAVGRDYQDTAPTRGVLVGGVGSSLEVNVRMRAIGDNSQPI